MYRNTKGERDRGKTFGLGRRYRPRPRWGCSLRSHTPSVPVTTLRPPAVAEPRPTAGGRTLIYDTFSISFYFFSSLPLCPLARPAARSMRRGVVALAPPPRAGALNRRPPLWCFPFAPPPPGHVSRPGFSLFASLRLWRARRCGASPARSLGLPLCPRPGSRRSARVRRSLLARPPVPALAD